MYVRMYQALTGRYLEEREPRMQTLMEKKSLTAEDGKGIFNREIAFPKPPRVSCPTRDDRVAMCGRQIRERGRRRAYHGFHGWEGEPECKGLRKRRV